MEYIIHVIDESSQHKKNEENGNFEIIKGKSENNEIGDIVRSDAFYLIDDKNPIDAIISLSNIILIKDFENNEIQLSKILSQTGNENSSIEDDDFTPIATSSLEIVDNNNSELTKITCQIKKGTNDQWIEFHNISFFAIPREKIIFIK